MPNPFYVEPGNDWGTGLMGLSQSLGQAVKQRDERNLFKNAQTKENYIQSLFQAIQDPDRIEDIANQRTAFLESQGLTPDEMIHTTSAVERYNEDPEGFVNMLKQEVAYLAPERWEKYQKAIGGEPEDEYKDLETGYKTFLKSFGYKNSPDHYEEYEKRKVSLKKQMDKQPVERPYITELMANGYMPSSRITGPMLDAFEAMAKKAAEDGNPLTPENLYSMEFTAQKNRAIGRTAGSRAVVARKQNIETAYGLLDDMLTTGSKLNYSDVRFKGNLDAWKNGQLNDPVFTEYMTQRADSLFILGNALKQNGLTDKSIEVEEEAYNPTLSPRALKAWVNAQRRALNRAAKEIETDYKYEMGRAPTVEPGIGGKGMEDLITVKNPDTNEWETWNKKTGNRVK